MRLIPDDPVVASLLRTGYPPRPVLGPGRGAPRLRPTPRPTPPTAQRERGGRPHGLD